MTTSPRAAAVDLTVIVVSHGHEQFLPRCLGSLPAAIAGLRTQVLIVDNASTGRMQVVARNSPIPAEVRVNASPVGFAANCNRAIRETQSRYVLLLNPDTAFLEGRLDEAVACLEQRPDAGVLGCRLVDSQGAQQESYRRFPTLAIFLARICGAESWPWRPRFYDRAMMRGASFTEAAEVDLVTGAFFLIRRSCFDRIGGFDDGFFLYYEDADFCYRARQAGLRTIYYPGLTLLHEHQRSSRALASPYARWHIRSAMRYFSKHGFGTAS
jgi:GT2 family glycosyltransferase